MNKYQEALSYIKNTVVDRKAYGFNEPKTVQDFCYAEYRLLQELVDKATPKKPAFDEVWRDEETTSIYNEDGFINPVVCVCPNCGKNAIYVSEYGNYYKCCHECGQAIDWSEE